MNKATIRLLTTTLALGCWATSAQAGELILGTARAQAGGEVTIAVSYRQAAGPPAAGVASDIRFDPHSLTDPRCSPGAALSQSGAGQKMVQCAQPQPGLLRVAIYGLNVDPVPDGEVATVTFGIAPHAHAGVYRVRHLPTAADATGHDFNLAHRDGAIHLGR